MSGAVDLAVLKERADAQRAQPASDTGSGQMPPMSGGAVVEVTETNFETEVLSRSTQQLVVVALWSPRSAPTAQLVQSMQTLAEQSGGRWVLAAVDVDANPRIVAAFQAQGVPLVIAIAHGRPVAEFEGVRPSAEISSWVDSILSQIGHTLAGVPEPAADGDDEELDPRMAAAEELFSAGDLPAALDAYRAIVADEPNNVEAASLVRNLEMLTRATAHDPSVLDSAPDDVDGQLAAADVLLLGQKPDEAFDRLINLIKLTAEDDRTRARTRLLELFELFDAAEPFVVAARRKLATALY